MLTAVKLVDKTRQEQPFTHTEMFRNPSPWKRPEQHQSERKTRLCQDKSPSLSFTHLFPHITNNGNLSLAIAEVAKALGVAIAQSVASGTGGLLVGL